MGSENLHHRRKQQTRDALKRKMSKREPYDVVLMVCEGKTEANYLMALCDNLKLTSTNIKVLELGSDPLTIVKFASEEFNKDKDYDRVYCIFDKDRHTSYQSALIEVKRLWKIAVPIYAITSVPCFEYWLLLHFEESSRPYAGVGKKSVGELVVNDIKLHLKDYNKADKYIFNKTKPHLDIAIERAKKINASQIIIKTDNPSTKMHELIEYLRCMKNK